MQIQTRIEKSDIRYDYNQMNFIKNSWNSIFKKQSTNKQQNQPASSQSQSKNESKHAKVQSENQEDQIPQQILQQLFNLSSELVKQSKNIKDDNIKLKIYGYFKQATQGDCNTSKPQVFDFVGKSKWAAWDQLRGISNKQAMMSYVQIVAQADPQITRKIEQKLNPKSEQQNQPQHRPTQNVGYKKVEQEEFSYSHPYFKKIQKNEAIQQITHELLLLRNDAPAVFPLHFAIDKQRVEVVKQFLELLTVEQIQGMEDGEGTSILQYAELIENEQILQLVKDKLKGKDKQRVQKQEEIKSSENKQQVICVQKTMKSAQSEKLDKQTQSNQ